MNYVTFKKTVTLVVMTSTMVMSLYPMQAARTAARAVARASRPVRATWQRTAIARKFVTSRRWTCLGVGLAIAGVMTDRERAKKWEFIDVSRPSRPQVIVSSEDHEDHEVSELTQAFSELQFERDYPVDGAQDPAAPDALDISSTGPTRDEHYDLVLGANFWIFDSRARKKVLSFANKLFQNEVAAQNEDKIVAYHGTHRGAHILMNTVLGRVLNGEYDDGTIKLRDDKTIAQAKHYESSRQYQDELLKDVKIVRREFVGPLGGKGVDHVSAFPDGMSYSDEHPRVRNVYLPCNFALFGQSKWGVHGTKESSAEFVVRPLSFVSRALNTAEVMSSPLGLFALGQVVGKAVDDISSLKDLKAYDRIFDDGIKKLGGRNFMQELFWAYGIEKHYERYARELAEFDHIAGSGLVQISMSQACADRWAYVSRRMGESVGSYDSGYHRKIPNTVSEMVKKEYCGDYQMRLFLPGIVKNPHVSTKFYILAEPEQTEKMLKRMHEIAHEIKAVRA